MKIKHTRNVCHLQITNNTALRVILYLAKNKIEWYNENQLHSQVLEALYPVILNYVTKEQAAINRRKESDENNEVIPMNGYRILYRFIPKTSQQTLIRAEKEFVFNEEGETDDKPEIITKYKGLSIYPFELFLSVDDELFANSNTLKAYFQVL